MPVPGRFPLKETVQRLIAASPQDKAQVPGAWGHSPSGGRRGLVIRRRRALPALHSEKPRCQAAPSGLAFRPFSLAASKALELFQSTESVSPPRPPLITPLVKPDRLLTIGLAGNRDGNAPGRQPVPDPIAVLRLIAQEFPGLLQRYARHCSGANRCP